MKALCIAAVVLTAAGASRAEPPPQFLQATISGALSQIMIGQLAGRTSGRAEVRAFARAMAEDQTGVELKAVALAGRMGAAQPTRASEEGRQDYARLQALEGRDFDRAFLGYAIQALQGEIAAFKTAAAGDPGPASDFATDALPVLQKRLEAAKALQAGA